MVIETQKIKIYRVYYPSNRLSPEYQNTTKDFMFINFANSFNKDVFDLIRMHFIIYAVENLIIDCKVRIVILHTDIDSI